LSDDAHADPRYKWKVLGCVIFGVFMVILDTTVVNIAFPTLRSEFRATLSDAQWIVSVYVLALGMSTPLSGYLSDRLGIKRVFLGGLSLFVFGSFLCGLAPNLGLLIVARALQGIGGGIALPLGSAQLYTAFPAGEQGRAFGYFGIVLMTAPALGPLLGGVLVDQGLWRWIFFVNVPIGVLGVWLGTRWLRESKRSTKPHLDVVGLLLALVAFGSLLYAASIAATVGWTATRTLVWFAAGFVSLVGFVLTDLHSSKEPLLDFRLFERPTFLTANLVGYVSVISLFGAEFLMPVYLQNLRARTSLGSGLILLPLAITAAVAAPIAGRLYDRVGPRPLVVFGFLVLVANTWQLSHLTMATSIPFIMLLLAMRGLALGTTVQTTFATALGSVPRLRLARGSALINATRNVVQSIGVAILATVLASSGSDPLTGFENAYRLTFYVSLVAVAVALFLPGWPGQWSGREGLQSAAAA
jgi:EmrB/QacA subfamily drug resistance transporter